MLEKIIEASVKNRVMVIVAIVVILVGGIYAVLDTSVDAIPDLSDVQVIILTEFPGQALVCGLYREAGVRTVEIGSVMFGGGGEGPPLELVRFAIPRRVYTQSHFDYLIEVIDQVWRERDRIPGHRITSMTAVSQRLDLTATCISSEPAEFP